MLIWNVLMGNTALAELTTTEAAAAGFVVGGSFVLLIAWVVLQIIADWKIFTKAGQAGWKSIIPFLNYYTEYEICWSGAYGLIYGLAFYGYNTLSNAGVLANWQTILWVLLAIILVILHIMESLKLAKAFGKGTGFGVCLIFFGPIARLVLGFGSAEYVGKPE